MNDATFDAIVARLEAESQASPARYKFKVALLAVAGFGLLFVIMGGAFLGILLLAAVAVAVVASGGKAALLLVKLAKFLWVLIIPLWLLLKSTLGALFTRLPPPAGHEIHRADAPGLFAALDELRARLRGPRFHHVLVTQEMNAAVMQRPLFGLAGFPRNYLILGLPLLESLAPEEALAVVAHEYGHLAGSHGRFGAWIYRLRRTWVTIYELSAQWTGLGGTLLRRLVHAYVPYFNAYTWVLARANEYQADAAAADLGGAAVAANALKRVNLAAAQYDEFLATTFEGVRVSAAPPADIAVRWSAAARALPADTQARDWLRQSLEREKQAHDTHPVLRDRLAALPGEAARVAELPPPLAGPSAATVWLGSAARALRERLQAEWSDTVRDSWRERHESIDADRRQLAELRALASPSVDETLRRLQLQVQLESTVDTLPEVVAFNAATPDHAGGLYLEGALRLDRDDAAGVPLLNRAMALDPEATTAACQRLYGFLKGRGDLSGAEVYADRYRQRRVLEDQRYQQYHHFDPHHAIAPADLPDDDLRLIRTIISARRGSGIARAWVVRRILPADPGVRTWVVCVEPTWWARLRKRAPAIIEALDEARWPMPTTLCVLVGENRKALLPRLHAMAPLELDV